MNASNNTVLIVSLSTFPAELMPCRYVFPTGGKKGPGTTYYYQQEPFLIYLRDRLKNGGEIMMLCTPEVRAQRKISRNGETLCMSPEEYFRSAAQGLGLDGVQFISENVDQNEPSAAISAVVEHLRERKRTENKTPEIWIGTNGGLRGLQLLLEAILSLLSADGIRVEPDHVLSVRSAGANQWEVFRSASEFRIFDFVSGIKEFIYYGRIDSLKSFLRANQEMNNQSTVQLMRCLQKLSIGIQFGSAQTFDSGLAHLTEYFRTPQDTENPYMKLFRKTITDDFGLLLEPEKCRMTDKIRWCCKKGFWVQAYTLVESKLPREYMDLGIIQYDENAAKYVKKPEWKGDRGVALFNLFLDRFKRQTNWRGDYSLESSDEGNKYFFTARINPRHSRTERFISLLKQHTVIKSIRNKLVHSNEGDESVESYKMKMEQYINEVNRFYEEWEKQSSHFPVLSIKLEI